MPRILIADAVDEFREALQDRFCHRCSVATCSDGHQALELLDTFRPDILVVDLMLPKTDGISLLQKVRQRELHPLLLATTYFTSPYVAEWMQRLEVDYVMQKPCAIEALVSRLEDFLAQLEDEPPQLPKTEQALSSTLLRLGFSPKLDGYNYLLAAIPLFAQDPAQSITKELYVTVGASRSKDGRQVERSIRSAIEKAWMSGSEEIWQEFFPTAPHGSVPKPSNGMLIARLAQILYSPRNNIHIA